MDKLTIISGTLFFAADIFAIVSLAMPDWIITDVGGEWLEIIFFFYLFLSNYMVLMVQCNKFYYLYNVIYIYLSISSFHKLKFF